MQEAEAKQSEKVDGFVPAKRQQPDAVVFAFEKPFRALEAILSQSRCDRDQPFGKAHVREVIKISPHAETESSPTGAY